MADTAMMWRIFGTASAILAGIAARKVLVKGWKLTVRDEPPANPQSPGTSWPEAIGWAVASGAFIGLARMLATRKAALYYRKSTGHLPPGMEEVA